MARGKVTGAATSAAEAAVDRPARKRKAPPPPEGKTTLEAAPKRGRKPAAPPKATVIKKPSINADKPPPRKRGRKPAAEVKTLPPLRLDFFGRGGEGCVALAFGQGDTGQLGLGEDVMDRRRPGLVNVPGNGLVEVVAGGMHTVCLNDKGEVYTFGCNDEGSLGRVTEEDEECYTPGKVSIPGSPRIVQVTAGDSHTVALTENGKAWIWGTFRDSSGPFGLTHTSVPNKMEREPVPLAHDLQVTKIASGSDHVLLLASDGSLYSVGNGEQGQLGRVGARVAASRGGRAGLEKLLKPDRVVVKPRISTFKDNWAGSYSSYALSSDGSTIYVCGLNNYGQLGIPFNQAQVLFTLGRSQRFSDLAASANGLKCVAPGQHHALILDGNGKVWAVGRVEYGRCGLGEGHNQDSEVPQCIKLPAAAAHISAGTAVSFAATVDGGGHSWGMGTNGQLSHAGDDDDDAWSPALMIGKQLEKRNVVMVAGGGQHTVLLTKDK